MPEPQPDDQPPRLYGDLAGWYHLLTAPAEYAEEAAFYTSVVRAANADARTLLELGCGGGNNASFMKHDFSLTLCDRSAAMIEVSRSINPECEHLVGDMRTLRLRREFDVVFIHDAIMYLLHQTEIEQTLVTAFAHARPGGGVVVIAPDCVRENFRESTRTGGHDGDRRSLRYLEWIFDADPSDTLCQAEFTYLLREDGRPLQVIHDPHTFGLFPRALWLQTFADAGLTGVRSLQAPSDQADQPGAEVFVGIRP